LQDPSLAQDRHNDLLLAFLRLRHHGQALGGQFAEYFHRKKSLLVIRQTDRLPIKYGIYFQYDYFGLDELIGKDSKAVSHVIYLAGVAIFFWLMDRQVSFPWEPTFPLLSICQQL